MHLRFLIEIKAFSGESTNIASTAKGGTCTSSSHHDADWNCQYALDGVLVDGPRAAWASAVGSGAGTWISINFAKVYRIEQARFMSRFWYKDAFKDLEISFDNGDTVQVSGWLFLYNMRIKLERIVIGEWFWLSDERPIHFI